MEDDQDGRNDGQRIKCDSCMEVCKSSDTACIECGHSYCRVCLPQQFSSFIKGETYIHPKCCGLRLQFEDFHYLVSDDFAEQYEARLEQLRSPIRFCSRPSCSAVLSKRHIVGDIGMCSDCDRRTCLSCNKEEHQGECKKDEDEEKFMDLANKRGWQKCYLCGQMAEKTEGCNHMTCFCGAEWCYNCGAEADGCCCGRIADEHNSEEDEVYDEHNDEYNDEEYKVYDTYDLPEI